MGDLHACPVAVHEAIKADDTRWQNETCNKRPWDLDEPVELAECIHCQGTIARRVKPVVTDLGPAYARSCR